eukprot:204232-Pyramimonas_sp.AAC.1
MTGSFLELSSALWNYQAETSVTYNLMTRTPPASGRGRSLLPACPLRETALCVCSCPRADVAASYRSRRAGAERARGGGL